MSLGDVVDELLDKHSLAYTCTTEEANLTTLCVRLDKVDDLDAGEEHLGLGRQLLIRGGRLVDRAAALFARGWHAVN